MVLVLIFIIRLKKIISEAYYMKKLGVFKIKKKDNRYNSFLIAKKLMNYYGS